MFIEAENHKPVPGEILACYRAKADLIDGQLKRDLLKVIKMKDKAIAASAVMRKLANATELDSYRIPREMAEDILSGMSDIQILGKDYKFTFEKYYYTTPEHFPKDNPHWTSIALKFVNNDINIEKEEKYG